MTLFGTTTFWFQIPCHWCRLQACKRNYCFSIWLLGSLYGKGLLKNYNIYGGNIFESLQIKTQYSFTMCCVHLVCPLGQTRKHSFIVCSIFCPETTSLLMHTPRFGTLAPAHAVLYVYKKLRLKKSRDLIWHNKACSTDKVWAEERATSWTVQKNSTV
jgi:hypothetical protein